jgi:hypothetical protein
MMPTNLKGPQKLYFTEPCMHDGASYLPGESVVLDINDCAGVLSAGRGSLDEEVGAAARKNYASSQKAAAAAAAAQEQSAVAPLANAIAAAIAQGLAQAPAAKTNPAQ